MTKKEMGTIIFALENYSQLMQKEKDYNMRNYIYDLINKLDREAIEEVK